MYRETVDIVIVNYHADDLVRKCLESLGASSNRSDKSIGVAVYVVTDGEAPTFEWMSDDLPFDVFSVVPGQRLGFGTCCNLGIVRGDGNYVLLLNSDTIVALDFFDELAIFLAGREGPLSVGFALKTLSGSSAAIRNKKFPTFTSLFLRVFGLDIQPNMGIGEKAVYAGEVEGYVDQVIGAVWLIDRGSLEKVGGFDERFFVYLEDVDLAMRLSRVGTRSRFSKAVTVVHSENGTARRFPAESLSFNMEGRSIYTAIYFGFAPSLVLLAGIVLIEYPLRMARAMFLKRSMADMLTIISSLLLTLRRLPGSYRRAYGRDRPCPTDMG